MSSTLSAHSPKFESKLVSVDTLRALPTPLALGRHHKPVPHAVLVDTVHREIERRGYMVGREQLALGRNGAALFGVMDLVPTAFDLVPVNPNTGVSVLATRGMSFGIRNATDGSLAIRAVAGTRVFVCDNLAMSGSMFALSRKNTTRLDLADAVATGFDRFLQHSSALSLEIARLQSTPMDDRQAKVLIYDVFASGILPYRLLPDVHRFYFNTDAVERPDCEPRSLWGLHNACTRAIQDLTPARLFGASIALGCHFDIDSADPIDVEAIAVN